MHNIWLYTFPRVNPKEKKNGAEENTDFSQLGQGANSLAGTKTNVLTVAKTGGGGKLSGDSNFAAVDGATWQGFTRLLPCPWEHDTQ